MKTGAEAVAIPHTRSRASDFVTLAKPRLNLLVVGSSLVGYVMAGGEISNAARVVCTVAGTALVAGGASAFNQVIEREPDGLMRRTRLRPVPDGRLQPRESLYLRRGDVGRRPCRSRAGGQCALRVRGIRHARNLCGDLYPDEAALLLFDRGRSDPGRASAGDWMGCGQRRAVARGVGALRDRVPVAAPAFLAIAWIYREDYARAGFPMLPVVEPDGRSTGRQATLYCLALLPVSLAPTLVGMTGTVYFAAALMLSLLFLALTLTFARTREIPDARRLFFGSIIYLPILWVLMIAGRV